MLRRYLKSIKIRSMKRFGTPGRYVTGKALYGQGLEDMYLLRIFGDKSKGFFVDVGANDGIFVSNTYALYKQGWQGICFEPNPDAFSRLKQNRPQDTCLQMAIGSEAGTCNITWNEGITEGSRIQAGKSLPRSCEVEVKTLNIVFEEMSIPKTFELLSVDVEGFETDVLRGLDLSKYSPRIIIIEHNSEGVVSCEAFDLLITAGYRPILINRWNVIFSICWEEDLLKTHRGQDWFSVDQMGAF
jgi:FkbM family methyltransferase